MLWPVVPAFPGRRFGGRRFVLWSGTDLLRAFSALWSRIPGTAECRVRALRQGAEEGIDGSDQRGWAARCPHLPLRLEVRTFNQRARKQYEAAGFHAVRQYERPTPAGAAEFLPMEWPLNRKGHAALRQRVPFIIFPSHLSVHKPAGGGGGHRAVGSGGGELA